MKLQLGKAKSSADWEAELNPLFKRLSDKLVKSALNAQQRAIEEASRVVAVRRATAASFGVPPGSLSQWETDVEASDLKYLASQEALYKALLHEVEVRFAIEVASALEAAT